MSKLALKVQELTKVFLGNFSLRNFKRNGEVVAVNEVSFGVGEGEVVGLLGPNGAGKTTTIQMLLGALTPTKGRIEYLGKNFTGINDPVLDQVNSVSSYADLPQRMTVWENLDVYGRIFGVKNRGERIKKLLTSFEVGELMDRRINTLSAGQKTRILMVKAMINYPRVLLLDEPTASLDPDIAMVVRKFLKVQQEKYGVAMLFTSHNMREVEEMCDRIVFLKKGKVVAEDTPKGLIKRLKGVRVRLLFETGSELAEKYFNEKYGRDKWFLDKDRYEVQLNEHEVARLLNGLSRRGVKYDEIEVVKPTLEDYFLEMSGDRGQK